MISKALNRVVELLATQKHLADAARTFVVRVLAAGLAFGVQVFLARALALEEYGAYVTLWTWLLVVSLIAVFGFSESVLRFLPRYTERAQHHWALGFLRTGFLFTLFGSAALGAIGLVLLWIFSDAVSPVFFLPLLILAIGLPVMALELYFEGVSRSFGWYMLTIVPGFVARPLFLALGVLLALLIGLTPDAATVMGLVIAVTAAIVLFQALVVRRRVRKLFGAAKPAPARKVWVKSSLPLMLVAGIDELYVWSDILILGFLVSAPEVAVYFAAQRSMSLASFIQYAFMMVSAREFSLANAMRDRDELQRRISSATRWTFWMSVPAVLAIILIGYPLLAMFGPQFTSGFTVMVVLGAGLILRASVGQATDLLVVMGHQKANFWISGGGLVFNIVLSVLFVPALGILGAALATTITFGLRAIVMTLAVRKLTGLWVLIDTVPPFRTSRAG